MHVISTLLYYTGFGGAGKKRTHVLVDAPLHLTGHFFSIVIFLYFALALHSNIHETQKRRTDWLRGKKSKSLELQKNSGVTFDI